MACLARVAVTHGGFGTRGGRVAPAREASLARRGACRAQTAKTGRAIARRRRRRRTGRRSNS
eukprot:4740617-Prymnesium_polylepis.1